MRSRVLLGLIFGAIGGFLGFLLQERLVVHDPVLEPTMADNMRLGMFVGAMIGIGIGAVEGAVVNSSRLLLRGCLLGGGIGAIGGIFGIYFGSAAFKLLMFGKDPYLLAQSPSLLDYAHRVLARALGWTLLGAFPGMAAGAATLSRKRAMHGLVGGLLGGFIGGAIFDLVADVLSRIPTEVAGAGTGQRIVEIGGPSRAIGFTVIGALTGLFIGLVEELLKQAWVRVLAGKNEGKDYILSKVTNILGRDERADVPLFGDPNLSPQHAAIQQENGRHWLIDGGSRGGSVVNGKLVDQRMLLKDGDMIQLGQARILFREKATASGVTRQSPDTPRSTSPGSSVSMPSHLCPFCGAAKDAQGNCMCAVPGAGGQGGMSQPISQPMGGFGPDPSAAVASGVFGGAPSFGDPAASALGFGASPPTSTQGNRLTAIDGPYVGQSFALSSPNMGIGRDAAREIALTQDSTISRRHAHVSFENGQHVLYDDGSSNGTFVNNVRVSVQGLVPGDVVQLGASRFRYE